LGRVEKATDRLQKRLDKAMERADGMVVKGIQTMEMAAQALEEVIEGNHSRRKRGR
jgi:nucleoside-triphosphatase THEP1